MISRYEVKKLSPTYSHKDKDWISYPTYFPKPTDAIALNRHNTFD